MRQIPGIGPFGIGQVGQIPRGIVTQTKRVGLRRTLVQGPQIDPRCGRRNTEVRTKFDEDWVCHGSPPELRHFLSAALTSMSEKKELTASGSSWSARRSWEDNALKDFRQFAERKRCLGGVTILSVDVSVKEISTAARADSGRSVGLQAAENDR